MKHPVTKQKQSVSRSARRYSTFQHRARVQLLEKYPLVKCPHCGEMKLNHKVCKTCGYYGDRPVIDMTKGLEKITKIKA